MPEQYHKVKSNRGRLPPYKINYYFSVEKFYSRIKDRQLLATVIDSRTKEIVGELECETSLLNEMLDFKT